MHPEQMDPQRIYLRRMRDLRTDADLPQRKIAEFLHVSTRTYSHYETGERNISVDSIIKLADFYNVSLDYLVGRTDSKKLIKPKKYPK